MEPGLSHPDPTAASELSAHLRHPRQPRPRSPNWHSSLNSQALAPWHLLERGTEWILEPKSELLELLSGVRWLTLKRQRHAPGGWAYRDAQALGALEFVYAQRGKKGSDEAICGAGNWDSDDVKGNRRWRRKQWALVLFPLILFTTLALASFSFTTSGAEGGNKKFGVGQRKALRDSDKG